VILFRTRTRLKEDGVIKALRFIFGKSEFQPPAGRVFGRTIYSRVIVRPNAGECAKPKSMPIFEFHCPKCDEDFEELVRSPAATDGVTCPTCGTGNVGRKLSVFAARSSAVVSKTSVPTGGCGRCGDPYGPCSTE
jgi:putative FmdB family regulatory protein